jgi:DNA-binding NtrC family response regulator
MWHQEIRFDRIGVGSGMERSMTVLLVSYQPELFTSHAEALRAAGFEVNHAASLSAGLGAVGPGKYDLLVLAPNIPVGDRRRIEAEAKRRHRDIRIVLFYQGERERDVFASAILDIATPTSELVSIAKDLLKDARAAS